MPAYDCRVGGALSHLSAIIGSLRTKLLFRLPLGESTATDSVCSSVETCEYLANSAMAMYCAMTPPIIFVGGMVC